jgi:dTDP-4-amino-4,6-dideoxygalactose transaminase
MEGIQGAILRVKLRYLQQWTDARIAHAARYGQLLADSGLMLPNTRPGTKHVYHVYAVLSGRRRELMEFLSTQGIQTGIHYPYPIHLLPAYSDLGYRAGDFPVSERIATQELSLPMYPELTEAHIEVVSSAVADFQAAREVPIQLAAGA